MTASTVSVTESVLSICCGGTSNTCHKTVKNIKFTNKKTGKQFVIGITKYYYQFVADFNNTGNILFVSVADITNEESKVYNFPHNLKKIL
jgi:hypothetical protein